MSKFRIVTPKGASFTVVGGGYGFEKEALDPIGAEIVEAPANEAEFIAAARNADAIYAKGMAITKTIIDTLENCKVITLGSVGVDSVDVKAATARGIKARGAVRVADDGLRSVYSGDADFRARRDTGNLVRSALAIGFRIDACAGAARGPSHARRKAFQANEAERRFHQYRARRDGGRGSADQGAARGLDRARRP